MKYGILMTAVLMGCGSSPGGVDVKEGARSTTEQPLYVDLDNPDLGSLTRPVCFTGTDASLGLTPEKKRMFKDGILASWGAATQLRFTGWDLCPNPDNRPHVIQLSYCNCGGVTGRTADGAGESIAFSFDQWEEWARWGGVHEFGHALSFWHEQARPENEDGSWCSGPSAFQGGSWASEPRSSNSAPFGVFDPFSVMSYCQIKVIPPRPAVQPGAPYPYLDTPEVGNLSAIDIRGAQQYYQAREYRRQIWASGTVRQTDIRVAGTRKASLRRGMSWKSKDGRVALTLTSDGKLGVYRTDYPALPPFWVAQASSTDVYAAQLAADGVLRLVDYSGNTVWESAEVSYPGGSATLSIQQDGDVVIRDASNTIIWNSETAHRDELDGAVGLLPDESLDANDSQHNAKTTASGHYQLIMQTDGNLVVYENPSSTHTPLWATGTNGWGATTAKLRLDGTLVLMNGAGQTVWTSSWPARTIAFLALREDGNLVMYEPAKYAAWSTTPYSPGMGSETTGTTGPVYDNGRAILWNGETLSTRGTEIFSPTGSASLEIDPSSGNAMVNQYGWDVAYDGNGQWEDVWIATLGWYTNLSGTVPNTSLRLTNDGNLQLIDGNSQVRWSSNTPGYRNTYLSLSDNGQLTIFRVISLGAQNIGFLY